MADDTPTRGQPLTETQVEGRQVYQGRFLDVRVDTVRLVDGSLAGREYLVHPGAVMVVPLLDDGRLVMERQYRYPIGREMIEFPAGKLERGESVLRCAQRELAEETGFRAREWARAGVTHNAIAYSTEGIEIWFARGLVAGATHLDEGEFLDVFFATQQDLEEGVGNGSITDAKTLAGLLWLQQWRAGRWALDWVAHPVDDSA